MQIETFARLVDVPVFKAGTHNGLPFPDSDLPEIAAAANACLPFIQESITAGTYRENPAILLTKPIPGVLNLNHQGILPETFKEAVKSASVKYATKVINGVQWVVATFDGLKADIAHFLATRHPFRSVELIPQLYNPHDGKTYRNVIRSVGFLSPDVPPAVAGQTPHLTTEYAADAGILVCLSEYADESLSTDQQQPTTNKEHEAMPNDEKQEAKTPETIDVKAFMGMPELVAKLQAQIDALQATVREAADEKEAAVKAKDAAEQEKAAMAKEKAVVEAALASQELERLKDALIHEYQASPAFLKVAMPLLEQADRATVLEFSDGTKNTFRDGLKTALIQILTMKKNDAVTVPTGEQAPATHDAPADTTPENEGVRIHQRVMEYMAQHKLTDYAAAWTAVQTAQA